MAERRAHAVDEAERIAPRKAAAICGLSTKTLVKHARLGKIPGAAELLPGIWRFDEYVLRGWIRRREAACQGTEGQTSTSAARHGGAASRSTARIVDEAYERALKWRPGSA